MTTASELTEPVVSAAKMLAPDDLQVGDYVGVMSYVSEYGSFFWSEDASWKDRYARVDPEIAEGLRAAGEKRRTQQQKDKDEGRARSG